MRNLMKCIPILLLSILLCNCSNDDKNNNSEVKGKMKIKFTDAPIDDASVKSCFITVSDIKVDGQSVEGFNKTTVDILAYQNGDSYVVGQFDLEAKQYSNIELLLDHDTNAENNGPGCYIEEGDGTKHLLTQSDVNLKINKVYKVEAETTHEMVVDFDLRKCIKKDENEDYAFVSDNELKSAVRVNFETNNVIKGHLNNTLVNSGETIVYIYHKNDFELEEEIQFKGESKIQFSKAVNSGKCDENGNFKIHFLEDGEYELHFMSYERDNQGQLILKGSVEVNAVGTINLLALELNTKSTLDIEVIATGILGL